MSMIWLVAPQEEWIPEFAEVLSGFFAVRRIAGLVSLGRLLRLNEMPRGDGFMCIIHLQADQDLIEVHSVMTACTKRLRPSQLCVLGALSSDQRKLLSSFGVAALNAPANYFEFAKLLRKMMTATDELVSAHVTPELIRVGDIEVNRESASMRVLATGFEETLTPKEVRILQVLSAAVNQIIGREELVKKVWPGVRVSASTIDSHMSRLRKKIEQSFECRLETQYGAGWKIAVRSHQTD